MNTLPAIRYAVDGCGVYPLKTAAEQFANLRSAAFILARCGSMETARNCVRAMRGARRRLNREGYAETPPKHRQALTVATHVSI